MHSILLFLFCPDKRVDQLLLTRTVHEYALIPVQCRGKKNRELGGPLRREPDSSGKA